MTEQELANIRADFPILTEQVYGRPLVYLDNGATTQKPQCVIDSIAESYTHFNANVHRGVHYLSLRATERHEAARSTVAAFIGAEDTGEVLFTRGTTEAINLVAQSFGEAFVHEGDEVVVSLMEHHSNFVPWQLLCERKGARLRVIPVTDSGELDMEAFRSLIGERTRLVAVAHVSNVLGTINPVEDIISLAHASGIPVLIDGAQSAPHIPINVKALDADFYAFSGHKVYGPTGVGVLYGKRRWLEQMPPYQSGGEMIQSVSVERTTFNELPYKFEAGTPDYVGTAALAVALRYVQNIGLDRIQEHEEQLTRYTLDRLNEIDGMHIIGNAARRSSVISFVVDGLHPYDVGELVDKMGVAVRTGHHCAQPLIDRFGLPGTVRISFGLYNTTDEADRAVAALKRAVQMLR